MFECNKTMQQLKLVERTAKEAMETRDSPGDALVLKQKYDPEKMA